MQPLNRALLGSSGWIQLVAEAFVAFAAPSDEASDYATFAVSFLKVAHFWLLQVEHLANAAGIVAFVDVVATVVEVVVASVAVVLNAVAAYAAAAVAVAVVAAAVLIVAAAVIIVFVVRVGLLVLAAFDVDLDLVVVVIVFVFDAAADAAFVVPPADFVSHSALVGPVEFVVLELAHLVLLIGRKCYRKNHSCLYRRDYYFGPLLRRHHH